MKTCITYAQNKTGKITGSVSSAEKKPLQSVTVQLLKAGDKSLVKTAITGDFGKTITKK